MIVLYVSINSHQENRRRGEVRRCCDISLHVDSAEIRISVYPRLTSIPSSHVFQSRGGHCFHTSAMEPPTRSAPLCRSTRRPTPPLYDYAPLATPMCCRTNLECCSTPCGGTPMACSRSLRTATCCWRGTCPRLGRNQVSPPNYQILAI